MALENKEWYAFVINNRERLKEAFREVKSTDLPATVNAEQMSLFDFCKEKEFRIPLSEVYHFDSTRKDLAGQVFEWNVYKDYPKDMVTDKTRSRIEQKFEYYYEKNIKVEWFYKNGDKGDKYFSCCLS